VRLRGTFDGRERKCPKCEEAISKGDFLNANVPTAPLPVSTSAVNPLIFLAVAISLQLLSLGSLASSSTILTVILGAAAIASLIAVVVSVKQDRDSSVENHNRAQEQLQTSRQYESLHTALREQFDSLVQEREQQLTLEFEQRRLRLEAETESQRRDVENKKRKLDDAKSKLVEQQADVDQIVARLGKRFLADSVKFISQKLTADNFSAQRERLVKVVEFCRRHRFEVSDEEQAELIRDLRELFEAAVRKQFLREEQARIKEQIREEEKVQAQYERELKDQERERQVIEKALAKALREAGDEHSAEVEELQNRLAEAEEKSRRTKSMAELGVKAGHVYVLSNIGSFGEGVFKVGMSRRLDPHERVKELGSASVPFSFDVHMMISCDNAPELENTLHRALDSFRVNKVKLRKEFFRVDLETIHRLVVENHGEVEYLADPEALEYHESLEMDPEEFDMIHRVMDEVEREMGG
ncbi:MAG: GIY-YIG nuclease family protein, partial [Planctomycetes bacterium]|nr:GIY-YIG nuclease family protein [Planctomycetota bacterium]